MGTCSNNQFGKAVSVLTELFENEKLWGFSFLYRFSLWLFSSIKHSFELTVICKNVCVCVCRIGSKGGYLYSIELDFKMEKLGTKFSSDHYSLGAQPAKEGGGVHHGQIRVE